MFENEKPREVIFPDIYNRYNVICAKNVINCRRAKAISQIELAEIIGCSHNAICQIEKGNVSNYPVKIFIKLAQFFNVSLSALMFDDYMRDQRILDHKPREEWYELQNNKK